LLKPPTERHPDFWAMKLRCAIFFLQIWKSGRSMLQSFPYVYFCYSSSWIYISRRHTKYIYMCSMYFNNVDVHTYVMYICIS
jgi:hypothetical protein